MKRKESFAPPAVGGSSLLVIFAVLCLTVFSLLSLGSVQAERRLADAAVQSVTDYYEADLMAERVFARLRSGETIEGVRETDGIYEYKISISNRQTLAVGLQRVGEDWSVLLWQAVTVEGEPDDTLPVWKGTEENP